MKKESFVFGVIGLLLGLILGFGLANSLNRNSLEQTAVTNSNQSVTSNLPPNHPPFGEPASGTQNAALPQITEAIENARTNQGDYEAQMTAGDLYYQIQRFEDATEFYKIANKLRPNETEPLVKLGNSYFDFENFVEAEKWYELALKKTPNDISVRTDYGLTFFLRKPREVDRAIKEFQISLQIDPNHEYTLQNLVAAYNEKGDSINRRTTLDALRKVNPNNPALKQATGENPGPP